MLEYQNNYHFRVSKNKIYIASRSYPSSLPTGSTSKGAKILGINLTPLQAKEALSSKSSQPYTPPHFAKGETQNNPSFLKKLFPQQLIINPTKQQSFTQETLHVRQNK